MATEAVFAEKLDGKLIEKSVETRLANVEKR